MFHATAPVSAPAPAPAPAPVLDPSYCAVLTVFHRGTWAPLSLTGRQSRSPRSGVRETPRTIEGQVWLTIIVSLLQSPIKGAATSTSSNSILNRNNEDEMKSPLSFHSVMDLVAFFMPKTSVLTGQTEPHLQTSQLLVQLHA